jgi:hypothetical protein
LFLGKQPDVYATGYLSDTYIDAYVNAY